MRKSIDKTKIISILALILFIIILIIGVTKSKAEVKKNSEIAASYKEDSNTEVTPTNEISKTTEENAPSKSEFKGSYAEGYKLLMEKGTTNKGIIFSDGIGLSSGISNKENIIQDYLGSKLYKSLNYGTGKDWAPENISVNNSTICSFIPYIANLNSTKDTITNSDLLNRPYWILMVGLNDSKTMDLPTFSKLYRIAVRKGINSGVDVYCVTEPPIINMTTGKSQATKYVDYKNEIEKIAKEEGAVFVDVYNEYIKNIKPSELTKDGILPNDKGNILIADLIFNAMLKEKNTNTNKQADSYNIVANFKADSMLNASLNSISVSNKNKNAYEINSGGNAIFSMPEGKLSTLLFTMYNEDTSAYVTVQSVNGNFPNTNLQPNKSTLKSEVCFPINIKQTKSFQKDIKIFSQGKSYITGIYGIYEK